MSLDMIVQFVERKMSTNEFLENLYHNKELEAILSEDITLSPFTFFGETTYFYLLNQNMNTPGGLLNSLSILEEFLEKKQVRFKKNREAAEAYSLLLKVQPDWIDIPDWYMKKLLEKSGNNEGQELEEFLRGTIKQEFRYLKKPPKWLQSAQWIYKNEVPLLFVEQIDITEIRHDIAQLYVFFDKKSNQFSFVEQTV